MDITTCDACAARAGHRVLDAPEREPGLGRRFRYQECGSCGHVQLLDGPADPEPSHAPDHSSLGPPPAPGDEPRLLGVRRAVANRLLGLSPAATEPLTATTPRLAPFGWLAGLGLSTDSRICDVGCGNGELLVQLWRYGFRRLHGVDPHAAGVGVEVAPDVYVQRCRAEHLTGRFDAILLNHALEHMPRPVSVLRRMRWCLPRNGVLVVRVPVAGTAARRRHGADRVTLDAPRHQFVPTVRSMYMLADRAGLQVERTFFDGHARQFRGGERHGPGLGADIDGAGFVLRPRWPYRPPPTIDRSPERDEVRPPARPGR
jgi:SAM-dependent methyltransferase